MENQIEVVVIELKNKCDLNCAFCPNKRKKDEINFTLLKKILKNNSEFEEPIKVFEVGWNGNPLLYKKIEKILELFRYYQLNLNIVTNGFNLKDIIAFFEDELLNNAHFTIFFDSSDEEKNDNLMGIKGTFKKTIESLEYLQTRGLQYDILMRVNSMNYNEIEQMLEIAKFYRCSLLVPTETFPFVQDEGLFLKDEMKSQVIATIDKLRSFGEPIHKVIQFEQPFGNCTYLRKKRLFINSRGKLAFCHFISCLKNTEIAYIKNKNLPELIQINNKLRDNFVRKKEKELKNWKYPRKTASPCSYCLNCFGVKEKW